MMSKKVLDKIISIQPMTKPTNWIWYWDFDNNIVGPFNKFTVFIKKHYKNGTKRKSR
jgi:hypothetical protein